MRIFRYGFPGKNRRINLVSNLSDVQAVRVEIRDGVNPQRVVYVRCKGKSDIPLTRIGQPMTLAETEQKARSLPRSRFIPIIHPGTTFTPAPAPPSLDTVSSLSLSPPLSEQPQMCTGYCMIKQSKAPLTANVRR